MADSDDSNAGESRLTVLLALGANVIVGVLKLGAGLISGSGALLSEAAHSAGDSSTEILLLVAQSRSNRPADRKHPFGYGMERYFWSLLAAGAIFLSGAAFSIFEGLHTILSGGESSKMLWINYPVLALAAVFEGISFRQASKQLKAQARRRRETVAEMLSDPEDPTTNSVAMEDSTALTGLVVAALGVGLHQLTGDSVYDGIASLIIGCLLIIVAFLLARACRALLIGKQADPRLLRAIERHLEEQDEVEDVVDILSMLVGSGRVLLCVRADFVNSVSAGSVEQACSRVDASLREKFHELDEIFIQPVSKQDPVMRERVQTRYGRLLADE
jgi:cation diffusion facilitator family transporter